MKIQITMKDPDALMYAVSDAIEDIVDEDEKEEKKEEIESACKEWMKYGEYLTVSIDTITKKCEVIKPE